MTCPTCRRAVAKQGNPRFPFCCERCRLADLGRWLGEHYRIPDEHIEPDASDRDGTGEPPAEPR